MSESHLAPSLHPTAVTQNDRSELIRLCAYVEEFSRLLQLHERHWRRLVSPSSLLGAKNCIPLAVYLQDFCKAVRMGVMSAAPN